MIPELDRTGPTPIYLQIKDWIWQQVAHGIWPEHTKLKSETDLAAELGVNRGTVRKAISDLIDEGVLVRIHGRGTFVVSATLEQPLAERLVTFSEDLIEKGIAFETRVLEQAVIQPTDHVASLLAVPPGAKVFYLRRVRVVGQEPIILLVNYLAYPRCTGIERFDFTRYRLFEVLEEHLGLELDWGQRSFEARVADEEVARQLEISVCDPVMYGEQVVYLRDGSPIELSNLWFRGERYKLSAIVKRARVSNHRGPTPRT